MLLMDSCGCSEWRLISCCGVWARGQTTVARFNQIIRGQLQMFAEDARNQVAVYVL